MSELGITGKRVRKKPKYLRDDEEDPESLPKTKKQKNKRKSKKESKREKAEDLQKPGIKLKIKIGGKSSSNSHSSTADNDISPKDSLTDGYDDLDIESETVIPHDVLDVDEPSNVDIYDESDVEDCEEFDSEMSQPGPPNVLPSGADKEDTSDEEREWLDAVESGNIEEYEKQKSERKPSVLTARQRRRLHGGDEQLYELPNAQWGKPVTKETLDVRKQKAVQRRQLAKEKNEKAKKQTVDRLLNKSDAAIAKSKGTLKTASRLPHMRYQMTNDVTTLSLPPDTEFPLTPQVERLPPKPVLCAVSGCRNIKKYSCSKTKVALCSLECYKKNLKAHES